MSNKVSKVCETPQELLAFIYEQKPELKDALCPIHRDLDNPKLLSSISVTLKDGSTRVPLILESPCYEKELAVSLPAGPGATCGRRGGWIVKDLYPCTVEVVVSEGERTREVRIETWTDWLRFLLSLPDIEEMLATDAELSEDTELWMDGREVRDICIARPAIDEKQVWVYGDGDEQEWVSPIGKTFTFEPPPKPEPEIEWTEIEGAVKFLKEINNKGITVNEEGDTHFLIDKDQQTTVVKHLYMNALINTEDPMVVGHAPDGETVSYSAMDLLNEPFRLAVDPNA